MDRQPIGRAAVARFAGNAGYHAEAVVLFLLGVMTLSTDGIALDRPFAEALGDFLGARRSMKRVEGGEMRRAHPLLDLLRVALRTLIRADDFRRVRRRGYDSLLSARSATDDYGERCSDRNPQYFFTQRRRGAEVPWQLFPFRNWEIQLRHIGQGENEPNMSLRTLRLCVKSKTLRHLKPVLRWAC
jgi:hypothetical protein